MYVYCIMNKDLNETISINNYKLFKCIDAYITYSKIFNKLR